MALVVREHKRSCTLAGAMNRICEAPLHRTKRCQHAFQGSLVCISAYCSEQRRVLPLGTGAAEYAYRCREHAGGVQVYECYDLARASAPRRSTVGGADEGGWSSRPDAALG